MDKNLQNHIDNEVRGLLVQALKYAAKHGHWKLAGRLAELRLSDLAAQAIRKRV